MRTAFLNALFLILGQAAAQACSVCFYGDPTQQANVALRQGILLLLLVLVFVLVAFVSFFFSIAKRSKLQHSE